MTIEDLKKHWEAQEKERADKPWYIRIPLNIWDFIWYRVLGRLEDFPLEVKWKLQRITRGYSDSDLWSLDHFLVEKIRTPLKAFVKMECESGMTLPSDFSTDPAAWLEVLQKMEYAFDSVWLEDHDFDNRKQRNMNSDQLVEHEKKVQEGFELFGKYFRSLWE